MNKKEIVVEIALDGSIQVEAVCFVGADCEKATKFLEDALGNVDVRKPKPERYRKSEQQQRQSR